LVTLAEPPLRRDLAAEAARLDSSEVIYVPVRHHSPACAWHVRETIRARRPSAILIEGPRDFTSSIDAILDPATRAPVAFYTYAVARCEADPKNPLSDGTRRSAAYYPFCDYSPELVALREGRAIGAKLAFIDLGFAEQSLLTQARATPEAERTRSLLDERQFAHSAALQALARRLRCRDQEELWDHLVEAAFRGISTEAHVEAVYAWCRLARFDARAGEDAIEGTPEREREMAWHIAGALDERRDAVARGERPGPLLVVTGGYHTVVLPELVAARATRPAVDARSVAERGTALIRYSFDRLERLNGYAAGMRAPAYHQRAWEERSADPSRALRAVALATLLEIAGEVRKRTGGVPTATVIASYEHAVRIAALRDRPGPTREDVLDAVRSCFVQGAIDAEGAPVLAAAQRVLVGTALGSIPASAATPPLVTDVQRRARRQRLKIDDTTPHRLQLDIYRRREHRVTSRLLHALSWLDVPFASPIAGPDFVAGTDLDRLHEIWSYAYGPATEAALVEASVYGPTVPEAAAARFVEELAKLAREGRARDAAVAVRMLTQACVLGVHDHVPSMVRWLRETLAEDSDVTSVASAATQLALLWESREPLEARHLDEVPDLLANAFVRACFLLRQIDATPEDAADAVAGALERLRDLAAVARPEIAEPDLFWHALPALARGHGAALVAGAATGIMHQHGDLDGTAAGAMLRGRINGDPRAGIAFLRGLLRTAREIAWHDDAVLPSLDVLFAQWSDDAFVRALPELRLAFAEMTPRETDRIAERVAALHGGAAFGATVSYDVDEATALALAARDAEARAALVADGLEDWLA
jgi:hypothetical protein